MGIDILVQKIIKTLISKMTRTKEHLLLFQNKIIFRTSTSISIISKIFPKLLNSENKSRKIFYWIIVKSMQGV